jgi:hypothetical protein
MAKEKMMGETLMKMKEAWNGLYSAADDAADD